MRDRISCLTSHGGLTGVAQVGIPEAMVNRLPVGLSMVAARGADTDLPRVAVGLQDR